MTAASAAQPPREPQAGPLDRFVHDVDVTRFDSRLGRIVPIALAVLVGVIAANLGGSAALAAGILIAAGLVVVVLVLERDRWRAQDVLHWYLADRSRRWRAATGSDGPMSADPAEAEVWLGAHPPGSVPQVYRAIAAVRARNEVVVVREIAALPDATPDDRAWRQWVIQSARFVETGNADGQELRSFLPDLADPDDRTALETWLAQVDAARLHAQGDRAWLAPLVQMWSRTRRVSLGGRRTARLWISRFIVLPIFALSAVAFGSIGLQLGDRSDGLAAVPADYAKTEIATRGDVGDIDDRRLVASLPGLAASLATATRLEAGALDAFSTNDLIAGGLPTLIWDTHRISLAPPPDAPARRVWSIEVLLDGDGLGRDAAIVTFDAEAGDAYLYRIDPGVVASIAAAVGNEATGSP